MGFQDETWWSRLKAPRLFAWADKDRPLQLVEKHVAKDDPDPKALAAYGILLRFREPDDSAEAVKEEVWLRFVEGRPVSSITTQFLAWTCERLTQRGKTALLMPWDNASWHISQEVRGWIRAHNGEVKQKGKGVRIIGCYLPTKSPWLNPIEPKWVHAKRKVAEPDSLIGAKDLAERVCAVFHSDHYPHLSATIPKKAA